MQQLCSDNDDGQGNKGTDAIPTILSYSGSPGCTCDMTDKSPVDFFQLLIPDDLFQVVVDELRSAVHQCHRAESLLEGSRVGENSTYSC